VHGGVQRAALWAVHLLHCARVDGGSGSGSEEVRGRSIAATAFRQLMLFLVLSKNRNFKTNRNVSLPAVFVGVKLGLLH
jgi:hypothetical protein